MLRYSLDEPYPAHLNARDARDAYLAENGFKAEEYDLDVISVTFWGITFRLPNPASRKLAVRYHDLHHVITGYGTDPTGESEISAWELRRGISIFGWYVQAIIMTGALFGLVHSPRRTWRALRAGKSTVRLPKPTFADYETLLTRSVGELREIYDVPQQGLTTHRALHEKAPCPQA